MKKFIGKKIVQAELMTCGEAHKQGLVRDYVDEYVNKPGYLVVYEDGYKSWSPKDVFESAYKVADTMLDRLNIECGEMITRTDKLGDFIYNQNDGKDFQSLPLGTKAMLLAQHHVMCAYTNLLNLRQSCVEAGEDCNPSGLSFEQVLPLLREGFAIRREGWNGSGLMVFKQVPAHIGSDIIPKMQSLPSEAKRLILEAGDHIDYVSQCLIFNPATGEANSWVPSISDVFANDWQLVLTSK
ncbi:MAG: DUF2829 domain-containing protein [Lachnospiraceae bacterium]|nr:DUF2829 domain-containing protein [Lachnospiraceae bacterium]